MLAKPLPDLVFMRSILYCLLIVLLLSACEPRLQGDLPTEVPADLDAVATAIRLTENAPPVGFRDGIRVPQLDSATDELAAWRAQITLRFEGFFAGTTRQTRASTTAEIQHTLLGSKRRVVLTVQGDIFEQTEPLVTEGVRLGPDTFFVRANTCTPTTGSEAAAIADLTAADLIGGITFARPDGTKAVINGQPVWRYVFQPDAMLLTNLQTGDGGRVLDSAGELWFAPAQNAVIRFYLTMDVENATLFGSQLPVTGAVIMQYDLLDIGVEQNINVPFGC